MKTAELRWVEANKHFDTCFDQVLTKLFNCPIKLWVSRGAQRGGWTGPEMQERIVASVGFKSSPFSFSTLPQCKGHIPTCFKRELLHFIYCQVTSFCFPNCPFLFSYHFEQHPSPCLLFLPLSHPCSKVAGNTSYNK